MVLNGIFENNKLTGGAMRLSGYGSFFDGTWLSRSWSTDSGAVVPASPHETVQPDDRAAPAGNERREALRGTA